MTLDVVGAPVTFLIDPGATYSALLWSHLLSLNLPTGGWTVLWPFHSPATLFPGKYSAHSLLLSLPDLPHPLLLLLLSRFSCV